MQHDLPPGFHAWPGNRKPRDPGPFYIMLRCGFVDTRIAYTRDQLVWTHDGSSGDIIGVRRVADAVKSETWDPKSGGY